MPDAVSGGRSRLPDLKPPQPEKLVVSKDPVVELKAGIEGRCGGLARTVREEKSIALVPERDEEERKGILDGYGCGHAGGGLWAVAGSEPPNVGRGLL